MFSFDSAFVGTIFSTGQVTIQINETEPDEKNGVSMKSEAKHWSPPVRAKLTKDGYFTLSLLCTVIAGVQAQLISLPLGQDDPASQLVSAFFFSGLIADLGGSVLCSAASRWFEMLTQDEAKHIYGVTIEDTESKGDLAKMSVEPVDDDDDKRSITNGSRSAGSRDEDEDILLTLTELWMCASLRSGPYVAILGLGLLVAGLMVEVWAHQALVVKLLCTVLSAMLVMLLPPFVLRHDRKRVLKYAKLRRFSG
ncbi:hypothetical protein AX17_001492 [Amanita inopinata Kibby_2008]|nr:hypothetical protein AX17_001492 [Amanita inopinata Kibby_2008]